MGYRGCRRGQALATDHSADGDGVTSRGVMRGRALRTTGNPQVSNQTCARICVRDATGRVETRGRRRTRVTNWLRLSEVNATLRDQASRQRQASHDSEPSDDPPSFCEWPGSRPLVGSLTDGPHQADRLVCAERKHLPVAISPTMNLAWTRAACTSAGLGTADAFSRSRVVAEEDTGEEAS